MEFDENRNKTEKIESAEKESTEINREQGIEYIGERFQGIDIKLSEKQKAQFFDYYVLLTEKNKVMNLTAITEFHEVVLKHFIDSCFCPEYIGEKKEGSLIDIGTGAGLPGIPLKIIYPELHVTLLDSLNKRVLFLNEVIEKLNLRGIQTVHARAEDGAKNPKLREQFDFAVSRAVANLSTLSEYCLPYVKVGGIFAAYKSGHAEDEVEQAKRAIFLLGGKAEKTEKGVLPESDIERSIFLIRKKDHTSKKYPRKAGLPGKQPL